MLNREAVAPGRPRQGRGETRPVMRCSSVGPGTVENALRRLSGTKCPLGNLRSDNRLLWVKRRQRGFRRWRRRGNRRVTPHFSAINDQMFKLRRAKDRLAFNGLACTDACFGLRRSLDEVSLPGRNVLEIGR